MPPNFEFHLVERCEAESVAATELGGVRAGLRLLMMPTICASVNRDLRIWATPLRPVPRKVAHLARILSGSQVTRYDVIAGYRIDISLADEVEAVTEWGICLRTGTES
jgi:hypothetical protein